MTITEAISSRRQTTGFSIEVLPPLKGRGIDHLMGNVEKLLEFNPLYINITTHRSEMVYTGGENGLFRRQTIRSRPGTVAVAATIQQKYGIPAVPHIICSGFSKWETEYALIDLNFLGIDNLLLLRGDKAKHESRFTPVTDGYSHANELAAQINDFNAGRFADGSEMDNPPVNKFSYGVAGYPEKHDEAPNMEIDLAYLKQKVDMGASYIVTQMFFDNQKYYNFVDSCRKHGITVPIIPAIKPIVNTTQLTVLPKVFHVDIPSDLARELAKCTDNATARQVGIEWCVAQAKDLKENGVPSIHFYSHNATESVRAVAKQVY